MGYWVFKALLTPIFVLLWRVRVVGRHQLPRRGAMILAANHQSFCDSFFIPLVIGRRVTYLAKAEYFDSWRTAWFFRAAGQIPIRRGGGDVSQRALETARDEVLTHERILAVYPEGTRSRDDCVHRGRTGVARLARETGVPVVPVGVLGTDRVQPIGRRLMKPFHRVTIRFGTPMRYEAGSEANSEEHLRAFTDEMMQEIARLSERHYADEYVPSSIAKGRDPGGVGARPTAAASGSEMPPAATSAMPPRSAPSGT